MRAFLRGKGWVAAAVAAGALASSACTANQSTDAAAAARPGSFQSVMATKLPGRFGPHLAQADQPAADQGTAPQPGSFQAVMGSKLPGVYGPHLAQADVPQSAAAADTCQPGSSAAIWSVKLPPNARPGSPDRYKDCR
jgi:hypothetical protein